MSGGRFDYLYSRFDGTPTRTNLLAAMLAYCEEAARELDDEAHRAAFRTAAGHIGRLLAGLEAVEDRGRVLAPLMHAIEWCASHDTGPSDVAEAVALFEEGPKP
jgi:hypothetical protein